MKLTKKRLMFQEETFRAQENQKKTTQKFVIFWEMELSSTKKLNKTFLLSYKAALGENGSLSNSFFLAA